MSRDKNLYYKIHLLGKNRMLLNQNYKFYPKNSQNKGDIGRNRLDFELHGMKSLKFFSAVVYFINYMGLGNLLSL